MFKKLTGFIFAAVILLGTGLRVNAAQWEGTIRVSLDAGELPVTNGAITLYHVGIPTADGYRITESFGAGIVKREDALSTNLAQWLAEAAGETGKTVYLDVEGDVTFTNLEDGLYLIVQTERMDGFYTIDPFLAAVSADTGRYIQANPKTEPIILENPQTGQPIAPLLGAMGMVVSGVALYLFMDKKRRE